MSLRDLTRSTPFRLTLRLTVIFAASMLVCFAVAFLLIRRYLDTELHNQVTQEIIAWQAASDADDLRDQLMQVTRTTPPQAELIVLITDAGQRIANVPDFGPVDGFRIVSAREIGLGRHRLADSYLVTSAPVAGGRLILGRDRERVSEELGEIFVMMFLFVILPTLMLAGGLGLITAQAARRRVEMIRDTLSALTEGNLAARVSGIDSQNDDLTQIGHAVNLMAATQAASTESLRQVSADVAHDLKTPIQRVSVLLDRLQGAGALTPLQDRALEQARAETRQIVATFQSLLQIAQIDGGASRSHFTRVDLSAVVADIADVYAPAAEESGHAFVWSVPDQPVLVAGDRNLLGQIPANLIENALRHTRSGSRIAVQLDSDGVLSVADNGPGIPPEERNNVLRRLYRLERSRTTEGSGLGLALVASIVDLHGASLGLSDAAPGLSVEVRFRTLAPDTAPPGSPA